MLDHHLLDHHRRTALTLTFCALFATACTMTDEIEPDAPTARAAELDSVRYAITPSSELSQDQLHAIAQFVEAQGQDVHQAKVALRTDDQGPTSLEIELHGAALPGDDLPDALRSAFAELADAEIEILEADGDGPPELSADIQPEDDAATIEQKVIADLRAKGVEGEIDVTVTPTDDGHRAIEVEVHDEPH